MSRQSYIERQTWFIAIVISIILFKHFLFSLLGGNESYGGSICLILPITEQCENVVVKLKRQLPPGQDAIKHIKNN